MLKCKSCGGVYFQTCIDGKQYYHACPPTDDILGTVTEHKDKRDENVGKKVAGKGTDNIAI